MPENSAKEAVEAIIKKSLSFKIYSEVDFDNNQLECLNNLYEFSVAQILYHDNEVKFDPRKIFYKSNQELKFALTSICLSQSLVNLNRHVKEDKEFFLENINVSNQDDGYKKVSFGAMQHQNVLDAIDYGVVEDWKTYRDKSGLGIKALMDKKTNLVGLEGFKKGGDPIYEFARFNRKFAEAQNMEEMKIQQDEKYMLKNAMIQQQLLEGVSPNDILGGITPELSHQTRNNERNHNQRVKLLEKPEQKSRGRNRA